MTVPDPADPRAVLPGLLAHRGYRMTGPRRAVLAAIVDSASPLTVAEIYQRLGTKRANLVSVYRTVNLLSSMGLLRETDSTRGRRRYELTEEFTGHHHHLICQRCGRIEDIAGCLIPDDALARLNQRVRHSHTFRVTEHELRLFGICRDCE